MLKKGLVVGTIALVGALHLPAVLSDWYFFYWWYDVMMHALGGVAMGFLGALVWEWLRNEPIVKTERELILEGIFVIGFVAFVGIGWEWAEALADAIVLPHLRIADAQLGLIDTMLDLYFDLFGAVVSFLFLRMYEERKAR